MNILKLLVLIAAWVLPILLLPVAIHAAAKGMRAVVRHFRRENAKLTRLADLDGPR